MGLELTEDEISALVRKVAIPVIREEVVAEVSAQMRGMNARLTQIESQAAANGQQTAEGRREVAGLVGQFTMCFGTDGMGGTVGILIRNSSEDARRANDLAHSINTHLETMSLRGWLKDDIAKDADAKQDKKDEKRTGWVRWVIATIAGSGFATWCATHFRHGGTK